MSEFKHLIISIVALGIWQCSQVCATNNHVDVEKNQPSISDASQAGWRVDPSYACGGYYLFPEWINESEPPKWVVSADQIDIAQEGESNLKGNVEIQYGQRSFQAQSVRLNSRNNQLKEIEALSQLKYADPSMKIFGQSGHWHADNDTITINEPTYYYYPRHARGSAHQVVVTGKQKVSLADAEYTTCAPDKTTWALQGHKISLNRDTGQGQAKDIRLKFKDTTVFYWPYLQFPIDNKRHSGFLYPQAGSTTQSGIELSLPYYWNIAPNYDATFTPRVLTSRGVELQSEFRYLTPNANGDFKLHFLPNDTKYRDFRRDNLQNPPIIAPLHDPRITALEGGNHRVGLSLLHKSTWRNTWSFDVDYTYVSDDNYFYDLENDLDSASTTKLTQMASLRYNDVHWHHAWQVQAYELLHPLFGPINSEDYRRLPQWAFSAWYPNVAGLTWTLDGEIVHFTHAKDPFSGAKITQGTRYHLKPGISMPFTRWWGFFTPRVQADFLGHDLDLSTQDAIMGKVSNNRRVIPIFDLDTGLYFDKYYQNGYRQTLEPRVYYLYVPYRDQSLTPTFDTSFIDFSYFQMFRDNRFIGRDRLGDTHQTTVALTTRVLNKNSEERFRATIGEIFYFKDRRVGLCTQNDFTCLFKEDPDRNKHFSPIIGNVTYTPNQDWYLSGGIEFNPNHGQVDKGYSSFQYAPEQHQAIALNYYWMRRNPFEEQPFLVEKPLHQADIGLFWPIHKGWDFLGVYRHDIENKRLIEALAGLEYDTCCLAFQVVGNRFLRPNDGLSKPEYANGVFFQVLFKGLSNLGSKKADEKLRKSIPRYRDFAKRNDFGA